MRLGRVYSRRMANETQVLSLGGSIVAPDRVDVEYLRSLRALLARYLAGSEARRLVIVVGGGAPARDYQRAYREIAETPDTLVEDWIGVAATRLNGQLVHGILAQWCREELVVDPTAVSGFEGRVLVAAGWKPGFSTDFDAVLLAERFGAEVIVNLSNISHVYSGDPKRDPSARALETIGWDDFRALVGDRWTPGQNVPFDPVATARAAEMGLTVIVAGGKDLPNLDAILEGRVFRGTRIGPD